MKVLTPYRNRIDALDDRIVDLLAERLGIIHEVAVLKQAENIPAVLPDRVAEVRNRVMARAAEKGVDPNLAGQLYTLLIDYCCDLEDELMSASSSDPVSSRAVGDS